MVNLIGTPRKPAARRTYTVPASPSPSLRWWAAHPAAPIRSGLATALTMPANANDDSQHCQVIIQRTNERCADFQGFPFPGITRASAGPCSDLWPEDSRAISATGPGVCAHRRRRSWRPTSRTSSKPGRGRRRQVGSGPRRILHRDRAPAIRPHRPSWQRSRTWKWSFRTSASRRSASLGIDEPLCMFHRTGTGQGFNQRQVESGKGTGRGITCFIADLQAQTGRRRLCSGFSSARHKAARRVGFAIGANAGAALNHGRFNELGKPCWCSSFF